MAADKAVANLAWTPEHIKQVEEEVEMRRATAIYYYVDFVDIDANNHPIIGTTREMLYRRGEETKMICVRGRGRLDTLRRTGGNEYLNITAELPR